MGKVDRGLNLLGDALLFVTFIMILLIGTDIFFQAFVDLRQTDLVIDQTLGALRESLPNASPTDLKKLIADGETFFTRLENAGRNELDSSAISFLFEIFSMSLVSAGIYLLNRSHRNLRDVEKKAELMVPFIDNALTASTVSGRLLEAYQDSWLLRTAGSDHATADDFVQARDSINLSRNELQRAFQDRSGFDSPHHALFLDVVGRIENNLERFGDKERVKYLIDDCNECTRLLREGKFVENHGKQRKMLLGKWMGAEE